MMKRVFIALVVALGSFAAVGAQNVVIDMSTMQGVTKPATVSKPTTSIKAEVARKHFAWGMDAGSCIDLTGNDMSAIDLNAYFGYTGPYVRFAGVGAGIDMMVSSSSNTYPVYAMFRTDFQSRPQLCFLELRGGVSFSNIENYAMQTTPFGSIGVGVTLATGRTFSSHIVIGYNYTKLNDVVVDEGSDPVRVHDLQYASIKLGISF